METRNRFESDSSNVHRALVGGRGDCRHPPDGRQYLGNVGSAALYQCSACGGALFVW